MGPLIRRIIDGLLVITARQRDLGIELVTRRRLLFPKSKPAFDLLPMSARSDSDNKRRLYELRLPR